MDGHQKILLVACIRKQATSLIYFFALSIRWQKERAKKFPRGIRTFSVRDWLESLIHIHSKRQQA